MTLLINDDEVKQILTFEDTIEAVEDAYRQYGLGKIGVTGFSYGGLPPPKRELRIKGKGAAHGSPQNECIAQGVASLEETGMAILQHAFRFKNRRGGLFHLIDTTSGETVAIITNNTGTISWQRTGAAGAVAAKYLARPDSKIVGILGTGKQGRAQLGMLAKVFDLETAYAHSGRRKDTEYAQEMSKQLGIDVIATDGVEQVVKKADILVAVTHASEPLVKGEWVTEGQHLNGLGADCSMKTEFDVATLQKVDKLVIDCDQALDIAEIRVPMEQGLLSSDAIYGNIGEIVAGVKPSRNTTTEITLFESTGTTMPYVSICATIYKKAQKLNLGREVSSLL